MRAARWAQRKRYSGMTMLEPIVAVFDTQTMALRVTTKRDAAIAILELAGGHVEHWDAQRARRAGSGSSAPSSPSR